MHAMRILVYDGQWVFLKSKNPRPINYKNENCVQRT